MVSCGSKVAQAALTTKLSTPIGLGTPLEKVILDHFWTQRWTRKPTLAHALRTLHHSNGVLKGVDCTEIACK